MAVVIAGSVESMSWVVRRRTNSDTSAKALAVETGAPALADAIDQVRATLPEDRIVTSVAPY